jgi:signal transduction histidine kinase
LRKPAQRGRRSKSLAQSDGPSALAALQNSFGQLRALAGRLQTVREEERKRVARELHDQLGQALTALKIDLSALIHELRADKERRSESLLKLIDQTIQSVRRISNDLRPGVLDDLGLVAAIEWAAREFQSRTRTKCRLDLPEDDTVVDRELATSLFRILQETFTNIARHANATRVDVISGAPGAGTTIKIRVPETHHKD